MTEKHRWIQKVLKPQNDENDEDKELLKNILL
jgi:hypothetical protein